MAEYNKRPEVLLRVAEYGKRPEVVSRRKASSSSVEAKIKAKSKRATPEAQTRRRELQQKPGVAARDRISKLKYAKRPEAKALNALWRKKPENVVKTRAKRIAWRAIPENKEHERQLTRKRAERSVEVRLRTALRSRLANAVAFFLKRRWVSAVSDLGCTIPELIAHLESLFKPGMSWENYGKKDGCWSIDHIRPLSSFTLEDAEQQRAAVHFKNLQPLWHVENLQKGSSWTAPDTEMSVSL
jgi:hypothetical protein